MPGTSRYHRSGDQQVWVRLVTSWVHPIGHIALRSECAGRGRRSLSQYRSRRSAHDVVVAGQQRGACRRFVPWGTADHPLALWTISRLARRSVTVATPGSPAWWVEISRPCAVGLRALRASAPRAPAVSPAPGFLQHGQARTGRLAIVPMNTPEMRPDDVRAKRGPATAVRRAGRTRRRCQGTQPWPRCLRLVGRSFGLSRPPRAAERNVPSLRMLYLVWRPVCGAGSCATISGARATRRCAVPSPGSSRPRATGRPGPTA